MRRGFRTEAPIPPGDVGGCDQHPAARAWAALGASGRSPSRIEKLTAPGGRRTWKSSCYRLIGAVDSGGAVVAKNACTSRLLIERAIYLDILPLLPITTLRCYGCVENDEDGSCWLFLEDAGDLCYDDTRAPDRALAADWLAEMHTATSALSLQSVLPDRGPHYYLEVLHEARLKLLEASHDPRLGESRPLLTALGRHCDALEAVWGDIEGLCGRLRKSLVHGDFTAKNVRVRGNGSSQVLCVMDWDVAGWGPPASDIAALSLGRYRSRITGRWPEIDLVTLREAGRVGRIFRLLLWVDATSTALASRSTERALRKLEHYEHALAAERRELGCS